MINAIGRILGGYFWLNVLLNVLAIAIFFILGIKAANWQLGVLMAGSFAVLILTSIRIGNRQLFHVFPGRGGWAAISVILIVVIGSIWFFGDQLLSATSNLRITKFNRWSVEVDQRSVGERIFLIKEGTPYFTEDLKKAGIAGPSEEGYYVNQKLKHEGEELIGLMLRNGSRFVGGQIIFVPVRDVELVKVYSKQEQRISQLSKAKQEADAQARQERLARERAEKEAVLAAKRARLAAIKAQQARSQQAASRETSLREECEGKTVDMASLKDEDSRCCGLLFSIPGARGGDKIKFLDNLVVQADNRRGGSVGLGGQQILCWRGTNKLFIERGSVYRLEGKPFLSAVVAGNITSANLPKILVIKGGV